MCSRKSLHGHKTFIIIIIIIIMLLLLVLLLLLTLMLLLLLLCVSFKGVILGVGSWLNVFDIVS